ncbi:MAG: hypothetical protein JWM88_2069 [Verrucomicrobia bacterium]|nr:hypothetical protein [Verrucomicrobiota bacterium]
MIVRHWSTSLLLAMLAASPARPADKSPAPPAGPGDDSIASAKKDYESFRNSRTAVDPQRAEMPGLSAPALHLGNDDSAEFTVSAQDRKKEREAAERKPDHWLVDAMNDDRRGGRSSGSAKGARKDESENRTSVALGGRETIRPVAKSSFDPRRSETDRKPVSLDNPLNTFMAVWMTPKDFDLLKVRGSDLGVSDAFLPSVGDPRSFNGTRATPGTTVAVGQVVRLPDQGPNPYLAAPSGAGAAKAESPKPLASMYAPASVKYAPIAFPMIGLKGESASNDRDRGRPDLLKPTVDAKYFPQLKRF